jgi:hypothetical protein
LFIGDKLLISKIAFFHGYEREYLLGRERGKGGRGESQGLLEVPSALVSKFLPKRQIPQPSKSIISCYSRLLSVLISYDGMRYTYVATEPTKGGVIR